MSFEPKRWQSSSRVMWPTCRRSKQPLVKTMVSPVARHSLTRARAAERLRIFSAETTPELGVSRATSSAAETGTVPTLPTTTPAARLASSDGGADRKAGGEAGGQGGDDGVAGAGDVEDLAGAGWVVLNVEVSSLRGTDLANAGVRGRAEDGDAPFGAGNGEELQFVLGHESLPGGKQGGGVSGGDTGRERELGEVGADGGGAGVLGEVVGFGVDEHGDAVLAGRLG